MNSIGSGLQNGKIATSQRTLIHRNDFVGRSGSCNECKLRGDHSGRNGHED